MFDPTSRYFAIETNEYVTKEGRTVAYKRRRFLPRSSNLTVLTEVVVTDSDRLDLIASRTLGNPELFWQVCDANEAMNPHDLTSEPGQTLRVPMLFI
jgi:hypothetical protein